MTARLGRYPTRFDGQGPAATIAPPLEQTTDEIGLLEHLDRDWAVPCEYAPSGSAHLRCGAPATWWVICRDCGRATAQCDRCRAQQDADLSTIGRFGVMACSRCSACVPASRWRDLFIVEPIGRLA